ncbi:MAG: alanine--tRNA ligase-related protein [Candidatus Shikimatogenerans bostrichidophilus]|nr:MAG: alanine--tRNA ligase-related protein [Candidatus Shikimatogenerans bostrichidophilus]
MKYNKIKKKFIYFFKKNNHKILNSSRIINKDNSKLLFINSGINIFKDLFLNNKKIKYNKIANIQKCIRINDIKSVGIDNYHHTYFEMLGNWSIGKYSIKKAIQYSWILITKIFKISPKYIYITIFKGDKKKLLKKDYKSYKYWKKFINKKRIFFRNIKNNFWKIDNFNLCGPCTEIYININKKKYKKINFNNKNLIELWNIVNIKYLVIKNKIVLNKNLLSNNYIDTGMGLERLAMILQNKKSTYDIDIFIPIIKKIEKILKIKYNKNKKHDILIKILSDHIRSICYIMYNKIYPNNNKYGYVLRKIIRRCLIYRYKILNNKQPFLFKLVSTVYKIIFKKKNQDKIILIKNKLKEEEIFYFISINKNIKLMLLYLKKNKIKYLNKDKIIYIYSTYGIYYFILKKISLKNKIKIDKFIEVKKDIEL